MPDMLSFRIQNRTSILPQSSVLAMPFILRSKTLSIVAYQSSTIIKDFFVFYLEQIFYIKKYPKFIRDNTILYYLSKQYPLTISPHLLMLETQLAFKLFFRCLFLIYNEQKVFITSQVLWVNIWKSPHFTSQRKCLIIQPTGDSPKPPWPS